MWVDVGTSERFRLLGRFRRGTKTSLRTPPLATPPAVMHQLIKLSEMIQKKIKELLKIVRDLQKEYEAYNKKFTLDGRLVGDIGEVIAMEKYQIQLYKKIEEKYDAITEYDNTEVQIKTTMNNSIWYPRDYSLKLLLALKITSEGEPIELYNGETGPIQEYLKNRKRSENYNYYTISNGVLLKLNKQVKIETRIKERNN